MRTSRTRYLHLPLQLLALNAVSGLVGPGGLQQAIVRPAPLLQTEQSAALEALFGSVQQGLSASVTDMLRVFQSVVEHAMARATPGASVALSQKGQQEAQASSGGVTKAGHDSTSDMPHPSQGGVRVAGPHRLRQLVSAVELLGGLQSPAVLGALGLATPAAGSPAPPHGFWRKVRIHHQTPGAKESCFEYTVHSFNQCAAYPGAGSAGAAAASNATADGSRAVPGPGNAQASAPCCG